MVGGNVSEYLLVQLFRLETFKVWYVPLLEINVQPAVGDEIFEIFYLFPRHGKEMSSVSAMTKLRFTFMLSSMKNLCNPIFAWILLWNHPNHILDQYISTAIGVIFLKLLDFKIILDFFLWANRTKPDQMTLWRAIWSRSTLFPNVLLKRH